MNRSIPIIIILSGFIISINGCNSTNTPAKDKDPELTYSPVSFHFSAGSGTANLTIKNSDGSTLRWKISSNADWLSFDPVSGTGNSNIKIKYKKMLQPTSVQLLYLLHPMGVMKR